MEEKEVEADLNLVEKFIEGSEESFEELIKRYSTKVYNLAFRLTKNAEDAEEVLQDVFSTVFRKVHRFEGKSAFSSWIYRVTMNAAFMNINEWARKGTPAPKGERLQINNPGTERAAFATDQFGHALGGVRSPYVDAPNKTYTTNSPGQGTCNNFAQAKPWDWPRLEAVYGTSKNYATKVNQTVDRLVQQRWFTRSDGERMKAELIAARPGSN